MKNFCLYLLNKITLCTNNTDSLQFVQFFQMDKYQVKVLKINQWILEDI